MPSKPMPEWMATLIVIGFLAFVWAVATIFPDRAREVVTVTAVGVILCYGARQTKRLMDGD